MIKLKLSLVEVIDGEEVVKEKEFKQKRVTARKFREALKFAVREEAKEFKDDLEMLDELVDLISSFFDNPELTSDLIYDGLEANVFAETLRGVLMDVLGGMQEPGKHPANQ